MASRSTGRYADDVITAFRELHGARLHGFALLLTLGDRSEAAALASEALSAGIERLDELRHPERAAAWLRQRVVDGTRAGRRVTPDAVLADIGAEGPTVNALASLGRLERAALIASTIERLDHRDVGRIVGRDGPALDRLLRRARTRYADAFRAPDGPTPGAIVAHILDLAEQAMA